MLPIAPLPCVYARARFYLVRTILRVLPAIENIFLSEENRPGHCLTPLFKGFGTRTLVLTEVTRKLTITQRGPGGI